MSTIREQMTAIATRARAAYGQLATAEAAQKNAALQAMAESIRALREEILSANAADMEEARAKGISPAMLDRLQLTAARVESIAAAVADVAGQADPVGRVLDAWDVASNGLHIEKVSVPLGVIGVIYEARPNVTADAAALCLKSGNAVILRGGSESLRSSQAIVRALHQGLRQAGLPEDAVQLVPTTDREAVGVMLTLTGLIDIIVPRGGKTLTERVANESRIPTIQHLDGNCHVYVHASADAAVAKAVVHNAKLRRTGICGSAETLLIDRSALQSHGTLLVEDLLASGCELRGDAEIAALDSRILAATEEDWGMEYLAPILAVKTVADVAEAITHINHYGSHHTDAIIATNTRVAQQFVQHIDSAIVLINASTQFADGGEFGFGGEIGIATGRLHARGPVGAAQLTTYKYIVTTARPEGGVRAG